MTFDLHPHHQLVAQFIFKDYTVELLNKFPSRPPVNNSFMKLTYFRRQILLDRLPSSDPRNAVWFENR